MSPSTPDVTVIVVAYRTPQQLQRCVASVLAEAREASVELLVVDNDAHDDAADDAAADDDDEADAEGGTRRRPAPPSLGRTIVPGRNLGFAAAVNLAAAAARGRHLLLLNPDTVVVAGAVDRLVAFADAHPGHGLYGGRTIDPEGRLDPRSCWGFPTLWSTACFATGLSSVARQSPVLDPESLGPWRRDTVHEVDVVTGCLCLVPREVWDELGGLDERFFVYGEDVDLALRARAAGYRPLLCPRATVVHEVGAASATRTDKLVLLHRGKVTLFRKHWSPVAASVGVALLQVGVGLRAAAARRDPSWRGLWRRRGEWADGHPVAA